MYYSGIYYGNNDYRDYVGHSLGEWAKHLYKAKEFVNGKVRYIYDTARGAVNDVSTAYRANKAVKSSNKQAQKYEKEADKYKSNVSYYKTFGQSFMADQNKQLENKARYNAEVYKSKAASAQWLYDNTRTGKTITAVKNAAKAARNAIGNLAKKAGGAIKSLSGKLISKGKGLVTSILSAVAKPYKDWKRKRQLWKNSLG